VTSEDNFSYYKPHFVKLAFSLLVAKGSHKFVHQQMWYSHILPNLKH